MTIIMFNQAVLQDFEHARRRAFWRDLLSRLTRKDNNLLSFDQVRQGRPATKRYYRGLKTVPLNQIVGSEGRYRDFDQAFFPRQNQTKERWLSINQAHYAEVSLPPVELYKVGQVYFVRDGNHRVSVARAHEQEFIDAYVIEIDLPVLVDLSEKRVNLISQDSEPSQKG